MNDSESIPSLADLGSKQKKTHRLKRWVVVVIGLVVIGVLILLSWFVFFDSEMLDEESKEEPESVEEGENRERSEVEDLIFSSDEEGEELPDEKRSELMELLSAPEDAEN